MNSLFRRRRVSDGILDCLSFGTAVHRNDSGKHCHAHTILVPRYLYHHIPAASTNRQFIGKPLQSCGLSLKISHRDYAVVQPQTRTFRGASPLNASDERRLTRLALERDANPRWPRGQRRHRGRHPRISTPATLSTCVALRSPAGPAEDTARHVASIPAIRKKIIVPLCKVRERRERAGVGRSATRSAELTTGWS